MEISSPVQKKTKKVPSLLRRSRPWTVRRRGRRFQQYRRCLPSQLQCRRYQPDFLLSPPNSANRNPRISPLQFSARHLLEWKSRASAEWVLQRYRRCKSETWRATSRWLWNPLRLPWEKKKKETIKRRNLSIPGRQTRYRTGPRPKLGRPRPIAVLFSRRHSLLALTLKCLLNLISNHQPRSLLRLR